MSRPSPPAERPDWPEPVVGGKYVRLLAKHLGGLRGEEAHGNRRLFLDDVFVAYLLAFYNPVVRSLRTIEDFSKTRQVGKHLSVRAVCKSTLSDFNKLADPSRLEPVLAALRRELDLKTLDARGDTAAVYRKVVAVDGTFLPALADAAWAIAGNNNHGAVRHRARLDARLDVATGVPEALVVPAPGESEADAAAARVEPGALYLYDRGFMSFALLAAHYDGDEPVASFVARYRRPGGNTPAFVADEHRDLTDADRAAGVASDAVGRFGATGRSRGRLPDADLREVLVEFEGEDGPSVLRLITNLTDVPAATVAELYRKRWRVELFFRWLKTSANFGHLISSSREGVLTHFYVTLIAVTLTYLHTGHRPSKYLFALLGQVATGAATLEEVVPILRERERRNELDRASRARRAAKKKSS